MKIPFSEAYDHSSAYPKNVLFSEKDALYRYAGDVFFDSVQHSAKIVLSFEYGHAEMYDTASYVTTVSPWEIYCVMDFVEFLNVRREDEKIWTQEQEYVEF